MSARAQSIIADFLHKRGVVDPYDFAAKVARQLTSLAGTGRDEASIRKVLADVRTDLFKKNPRIAKADVLDQLATRLYRELRADDVSERTPDNVCRILFVSANPPSPDALEIDEEMRLIQQKLASSKHSEHFSFEVAPAARPDDILQRLNDVDPHIVHFSGHGNDTDGILLTDDDGGDRGLSDKAIRNLFRAMKGRIRLVVLNACFSEDQAQQIAEHIDCVIGMRGEIGDEAAAVFSASLYRALAFGRSIQNAFDQGIAAISLGQLDEEDTPRLFTQRGVGADSVVLID